MIVQQAQHGSAGLGEPRLLRPRCASLLCHHDAKRAPEVRRAAVVTCRERLRAPPAISVSCH